MRKKFYKIVSSLMVCVLLLLCATSSALAAEIEVDFVKGPNQLFMEQIGFETKTIEVATNTTEKYSFITTNGVESFVEKQILPNGDRIHKVTEGEIENTLVLKANGDIILDGNLVKITEEFISGSNAVNTISAGIMPRAQRYEFTTICPYGSPTDYTSGTYVRKTLEMERMFQNIAESVWIELVCIALGMFGVPDLGGFIGDLLGGVLSFMKSFHPLDDAIAIQDYRYVHGTRGFSVTDSMSVAKHVCSFYEDWNYQQPITVGSSSVIVGYEVFTY